MTFTIFQKSRFLGNRKSKGGQQLPQTRYHEELQVGSSCDPIKSRDHMNSRPKKRQGGWYHQPPEVNYIEAIENTELP